MITCTHDPWLKSLMTSYVPYGRGDLELFCWSGYCHHRKGGQGLVIGDMRQGSSISDLWLVGWFLT